MPLSRPYMERNQAATTTPWPGGSFGKNNIFEVKLMLFHPGNVGDRRLKIYERGTLTMATPDMGRGGT